MNTTRWATASRPPFTSIVKYDLNEPGIQWRIGFGDDPDLAARGITGTGTPAMLNGLVVTAAGPGVRRRPGQPDPRLGQLQWQAAVVGALRRRLRRLAGDVPDERPPVPAGARFVLGAASRRGLVPAPAQAPAAADAPLGWVAYALPAQAN